MSDNIVREHRTVSRVTTILEAAAETPGGVRLATLARLLDAPKSSVHGLVKGLVATGYLEERDGGYLLGPAIGMLIGPARPDILVSARRSLEEIQRFCDETTMLCTLVGESVVYVDMVESSQMIRYSAPLRRRRPLYPTSAGKCFLAHFPPRKLQAYLLEHVEVSSRARVADELATVQRDGVAFNRGETVPDVFAVASPIVVAGRVVGCLAVAGPHVRMDGKLAGIATRLRAETAKLAQGRS